MTSKTGADKLNTNPQDLSKATDTNSTKEGLLSNQDNKELKGYTLEDSMSEVGGFGQYQKSLTIFSFFVYFNNIIAYQLIFLALQPVYLCFSPEEPMPFVCEADQLCRPDNYNYTIDWEDSRSLHNLYEVLNLECESAFKIGLLGSVIFIGVVIALFIIPEVAHKYGRKRPLIISLWIQAMAFVTFIFSRNIYLTLAMNFMMGFASTGRQFCTYVIMLEFLEQKWKNKMTTALNVVDATGLVLAALYFALVSRNWIYFQYFILAINLVVAIWSVFLIESPLYYIEHGQFDKARIILNVIAVNNKAPLFTKKFDLEIKDEEEEKHKQHHEQQQQINPSINKVDDVLTNPEKANTTKLIEHGPAPKLEVGTLAQAWACWPIRVNLMIMALMLGSSSFNFYLLRFELKYIDGNMYVNTVVASIFEIIAIITSEMMYRKYGIIRTFQFSFFLSSLAGGLLIFLQEYKRFVVPILVLTAKYGVAMAFNESLMALNDVFPEVYMVNVIGICNFVGRLTSMLAPLTAELPKPFPLAIFSLTTGGMIYMSKMIYVKYAELERK